MSETYVECLVTREPSLAGRLVKMVLIMLTAVLGLLGLIGFAFGIPLVAALLTGFGAYLVHLNTYIEYEYLYLDKEISIDKIKAQTRRKKVAAFEVERMEILAPVNSYHLDNYKNRAGKVTDYSIGREEQPDKRYVMYYDGNQKIILSPSEELVKAVRSVSPRKVFLD